MRSFQVEHPCPQCGGPVSLSEADRLFQCGFCRVRLSITSRSHLRYVLPVAAPPSEDLILVPYWRFRGMMLSAEPFQMKGSVLDTTVSAAPAAGLARSLGVRAQALKLRFATPRMPGMKVRFLPVSESFDDVLGHAERLSAAVAGRVFHRAFIGETVSLIYQPVYVKGSGVFDAILNRPVARHTLARQEAFQEKDTATNWDVRFLPALCPDCGWDLEGDTQSVVLLCRNCETAWDSAGGRLTKQAFGIDIVQDGDAVYVPFWLMRAVVRGAAAATYADLVRLANLPKAPRADWEQKPFHFLSPAFKTAPRLFLRLARQVSKLQPGGDLTTRVGRARLRPATVTARDAAGGLTTILASMAVAKREFFPTLPDVTTELKEATLVYMPFRPGPHEYVHARLGFGIQKNALRE